MGARWCIGLAVLLLPAPACKVSETGNKAPADTTTATARPAPRVEVAVAAPDPLTATYAPALNVDIRQMQRTPGGAYVRDLAVGSGAAAAEGKTVDIHYVGNLSTGGAPFDQNHAPQAPLTFTLGIRQVVQGFEEGVTGMKVGGRRQVVIPPGLAYGPNDYGPIPGNSILVFTIELVAVR